MAMRRRRLIEALVLSMALTSFPAVRGRSQRVLAIFTKIPWSDITNGIASAANIFHFLEEHTFTLGDKPLPICNLSPSDLTTIYFRCRMVALSLDALGFDPTTDQGDQGALPALGAYTQEPGSVHWKQARDALAQWLTNTQDLLEDVQQIAGPDMEWDLVAVQIPDQDLAAVTQALQVLKRALETFSNEWDNTNPPTAEDVQRLVDLLRPLPIKMDVALQSVRQLMHHRAGTGSCSQ